MPEPVRVIPIPCPFRDIATVWIYYLDTPEPAIVDTGVAASPAGVIEPALAAAGVRIEDVKWILATHGHWDHIGGAHAAKQLAPGAQVALHEADVPLLRDRRAHTRPNAYQGIKFRYLDAPEAFAAHDALLMANLSGELAADRALTGGERIALGGGHTVEVVHTPGHSRGSVSFVLDGPGWAFTGDSVQVGGYSLGGFPLIEHPRLYASSMQHLLDDVRPTRLYMGHTFARPYGGAFEAQIEGVEVVSALRESIEIEQRLASAAASHFATQSGPPNLATLAPVAAALGYPANDPTKWPDAIYCTMSGYL
jgi:hydroxyacylglutathione hydrolase